MMMRLLFAKALDGYRTAIVVDTGCGKLMGGVAFLANYEARWNYHRPGANTLDLSFVWEWCRIVDSADAFADARGWERPPEQISHVKMLEHH